MGYELDRLMQQFGVNTPSLSYSGMQMPVKPIDLAAGASTTDRANYDALLAKYNADMPLYTSDQAKYKTYSNDYNSRLASTSLYDAPQFQRGAMSSPGTGAFTDQYTQMYQDVLGRLPDSADLAYWKGKFGDMISPEEYAQFRSSAQTEISNRPKLNPIFTPRTVLEQPIYNTPTATPVLQTAAATTTNPYVLSVDVGGGGGNDGLSSSPPGGGYGIPGATLSGGISGPTTGLASLANSLAAYLGNLNAGKGISGAISDTLAKNIDPSFSHEGRTGRGTGSTTITTPEGKNVTVDKSSLGSFTLGPDGLTSLGGVNLGTGLQGQGTTGQTGLYGDAAAGGNPAANAAANAAANTNLSAAESAAADTSGTGGFTSGANADGYGGGDLGAFLAKGGYIGRYAQGGPVRHYQAGGDVDDFEPSQDFKDAKKLTAVLASRKLSPYEREDIESKLEEIYEKIKRRRAQEEPEVLTEPVPLPESLVAQQIASAMPERLMSAVPEAPMPSDGDLIQPMPESVPVTLRQISQAIANASPLTALKEAVAIPPTVAEAAPLVRPVDPRLFGESDEVATGRGYSPMDPRLYGETDEVATGKGYSPFDPRLFGKADEVATGKGYSPLDPRLYGESDEVAKGKGYSPMDPRLFGETNEVATGPGYSMPAANSTLLNLAAKYKKPGFKPIFAAGSIDPGPDQMALISRSAIANKVANPVINIQPEYADDSASRLSMDKPQDTTIPMSPNMAMLQKMLLANQSQASPLLAEFRAARTASEAKTTAFNDMLTKAIKGQDDNKPLKAVVFALNCFR